MKNMKIVRLLTAAAAIVLACSCGKAKTAAAQEPASGADGVTVVRIDSLKLTTIRDDDGDKRMPNKLFYGKSDSAKVERLSPEGSVPSSISCFLVEAQGKKVLFDTGNGVRRGGMLLKRLKDIGVAPEDIDYVVITHFHGDHIGGMTEGGKPVFTKAEVYVPEAERIYWKYMSNRNAKAAADAMAAYGDKVHCFKDADTLPLGIKPLAAPGHTPGHTVYRMGRLFVAGDLFHGLALQIQDLDICPSFDMNPEQAAASRKKYVEYVRANKLVTAGMHFPDNGVKDGL